MLNLIRIKSRSSSIVVYKKNGENIVDKEEKEGNKLSTDYVHASRNSVTIFKNRIDTYLIRVTLRNIHVDSRLIKCFIVCCHLGCCLYGNLDKVSLKKYHIFVIS